VRTESQTSLSVWCKRTRRKMKIGTTAYLPHHCVYVVPVVSREPLSGKRITTSDQTVAVGVRVVQMKTYSPNGVRIGKRCRCCLDVQHVSAAYATNRKGQAV